MRALAFAAFVLAILLAEGWLFDQSVPRALALIAAGLLAQLVAGTSLRLPAPPPRRGKDGP